MNYFVFAIMLLIALLKAVISMGLLKEELLFHHWLLQKVAL